jgi:hypothetical protein
MNMCNYRDSVDHRITKNDELLNYMNTEKQCVWHGPGRSAAASTGAPHSINPASLKSRSKRFNAVIHDYWKRKMNY